MLRRLASLVALSVVFADGWRLVRVHSETCDREAARSRYSGRWLHRACHRAAFGERPRYGPLPSRLQSIAPDPYIVCQIYDSTDPNARMTQIEFIVAKKLTRPAIDRESWNRLWHDHAVEIASGRVKVLDLPPDKAKEVATLSRPPTGSIYNIEYDGNLPTGKVTMAQAVGHKPLTAAEFEQSRKEMPAAPGTR